MHKYSSFYELLKAESPEKVFPGTNTVEEGKLFHSHYFCVRYVSTVFLHSLGMQMFKKWCDVDQEKKNNGVVAIHLIKSVSQSCVALSHILSVRSQPFPCLLLLII